MRQGVVGVVALGLLTAACGTNGQQRAATGGLAGLGVGALVGGPAGAVIGAAAGAAGGALMPEDATTLVNNMLGREHRAANSALGNSTSTGAASAGTATGAPTMIGPGTSGSSTRAAIPIGTIKEAQSELKNEGLYTGGIDGIVGPKTRSALTQYQEREGLQPTAQLDRATMEKMNLANEPATGTSAPQPEH